MSSSGRRPRKLEFSERSDSRPAKFAVRARAIVEWVFANYEGSDYRIGRADRLGMRSTTFGGRLGSRRNRQRHAPAILRRARYHSSGGAGTANNAATLPAFAHRYPRPASRAAGVRYGAAAIHHSYRRTAFTR